MYWNRFDICEAYYLYAMLYHEGQSSDGYAILGRLDAMGFTARIRLRTEKDLENNARVIFDNLVDRHITSTESN